MKKRILALTTSVLVVLAVLIVPMVAMATHQAEQQASTGRATTINITAQNYTSPVSTITFLEGTPSTNVSAPYNDFDGIGSPQAFGDPGTPVVTLLNGASVNYTISYNITTFTNSTVANEYYLINDKGAACASADNITDAVTFDTDTSTGTTIVHGAGNEKDLYLKITLSDEAGKSGTSTITILGES